MRLKFILFTLFLAANSANAATDTTATKNRISFKYTNEVEDKFVESDVVRLDDKKGFSLQTRAGDFLLKPYILVQTAANLNYYDDEGLNLADQDNIANSGFSIPNYYCPLKV